VTADSFRGKSRRFAPSGLVDGDPETYWATEDSETKGSLIFDLGKSTPVQYVTIQEFIRLGQRIRSFNIEARMSDTWVEIARGTTIGHKRIIRLEKPADTRQIRINILDSRACPLVSNVEIY
jgi:alpha-L-fucosidase